MAPPAIALIVGEPADTDRAALEAVCAEGGFSPHFEPSAEVATGKLGGRRYDVLVLDMSTPGAALLCMRARGKLLRTRIPVLALVDSEEEAAFSRAYRAGADEVLVATEPGRLVPRLRSLAKAAPPEVPPSRGDAVVADGDRSRGEVLERVLRDAGFRVELAMDAFAARLQVGRPSLKVAVVDASLEDVPSLIAQARAKGARCSWVIRARPEQLEEMKQKLLRVERTTVVNAYGAPDDVLFETNRLLETRSSGRAEARRLRGGIVRIGVKGGTSQDLGYTYNVSSGGLYVRTLSLPEASSLELVIVPPGRIDPIKLEGDVVWRREFGPTRREPVPAGFGVHLTGGDLEAWRIACPPEPAVVPSIVPEPEPRPYVTHPTPVPKPASILRRSAPSPERPRLPGKLRSPSERPSIDGSHRAAPNATESARPQSTRSAPMKLELRPAASEKPSPLDVPLRPREPQSSVEEIIASVLGNSGPNEEGVGSAPLSIAGDTVVELGEHESAPPANGAAPTDEGAADAEPMAANAEPAVEPPKTARASDRPTVEIQAATAPASELPDLDFRDIPSVKPRPPAPREAPRAVKEPDPKRSSIADMEEAAASLEAKRAPFLSDPGPLKDADADATPLAIVNPASSVVGQKGNADPWARTMAMNAAAVESVGTAATERPPEPAAPDVTVPAPAVEAPKERATDTVRRPRSSAPPRHSSGGELIVPTTSSSPAIWLVGIAAVAAAASFFVFRGHGTSEHASTPRPSSTFTAPAATPTETPPTEPSPETTASSVAAPPASAEAPAATATAEPTATAPAAPAGGDVPDEAALATLEHGSGFLYVASPLATNVYVYGRLAGTTNQRLVTKCGPRFIRLGTAPGVWQGEGFVQIVKCGGFTRVDVPH